MGEVAERSLRPPWVLSGSEVGLGPWDEHYLPVTYVCVSQRQRLHNHKYITDQISS